MYLNMKPYSIKELSRIGYFDKPKEISLDEVDIYVLNLFNK